MRQSSGKGAERSGDRRLSLASGALEQAEPRAARARSLKWLVRGLVVASALVGFALVAGSGSASASEAGINNYGYGPVVVYNADPGEANNVVFSRPCVSTCVTTYDYMEISDPGVGIAARRGCRSLAFDRVRCEDPASIQHLSVSLGNMDDQATVDVSVPSRITSFIFGGDGADILRGGPTSDEIWGSNGNDQLFGGDNCDDLDGGNDNDLFDGGPGPDIIDGGATGIDTVDYSNRAGRVFVTLDGPASSGQYSCGVPQPTPSGADDGNAGEGDNVWFTIDIVRGGSGDDILSAKTKVSGVQLFGGPGNDELTGGTGPDLFNGGDGMDRVWYPGRTANLSVTLDDGARNDGQAGEGDLVAADVEHASGGSGNDYLRGNAADNWLYGGAGQDTIIGGPGVDSLVGGDDNDILDALDGMTGDYLDCGAGTDTAKADENLYFQTYDRVASNCESVQWVSFRPQPIPNPRWGW
jgi:Ca2+-binding RTX toxin-like protein